MHSVTDENSAKLTHFFVVARCSLRESQSLHDLSSLSEEIYIDHLADGITERRIF